MAWAIGEAKSRRALFRALGHGPVRPIQLGVGTFSMVLLVAGVIAFAIAVPPYLAGEVLGSPVAGSLHAGLFGGGSSSEGQGSAAAADGSGGAAAGGTADGAAAGSSTSGGGASVLFPTISAPEVPGEGEAGGEGSPDAPAGDSGTGAPSDNPGTGAPSDDPPVQPSDPTGPSEAEEQQCLAYLRQSYDALAPHQQRIAQMYADYPTLGLTPSSDQRQRYFSDAIDSRNQTMIAFAELEEYRVPDGSRYEQAHQNILALYSDLVNASSILARAWAVNVQLDDPSAYVSAWMGPIEEHSVNGKLTFFSDYEARYPGARP